MEQLNLPALKDWNKTSCPATQLDGGKLVSKEVLELVFNNFMFFYYKI